MTKILYEIKEIEIGKNEPELFRQIKIYERTTEKLKWLLDVEESNYSEKEISTQTDNDLFETISIHSDDTLNEILEENITLLNNALESNLFINSIIFFQGVISLLLYSNFQMLKEVI